MVEPIDVVALAAVILGCLSFLIPIAGVTARFAIKPIAEALSNVRDAGSDRETMQLLERRVALLEQEVHGVNDLRAELSRSREELEFHRQLTKTRTEGQPADTRR